MFHRTAAFVVALLLGAAGLSSIATAELGSCDSECSGPCTGFLIPHGTCQSSNGQCMCILNTPGPGECALACDGRPCVTHCAGGTTVSGFCTDLTVDTGCACSAMCATPSRTPTATPTVDSRCPPDGMTLSPSSGQPGDSVHAVGQCYYIHSGRSGDVYFDSTLVGTVRGDTPGNYDLVFTVPGSAIPGFHQVQLVNGTGTQYQSAAFQVTVGTTATIPSNTPTPTRTALPSVTPSLESSGGGCAVAPHSRAEYPRITWLLITLAARVAVRRRKGERSSKRLPQ